MTDRSNASWFGRIPFELFLSILEYATRSSNGSELSIRLVCKYWKKAFFEHKVYVNLDPKESKKEFNLASVFACYNNITQLSVYNCGAHLSLLLSHYSQSLKTLMIDLQEEEKVPETLLSCTKLTSLTIEAPYWEKRDLSDYLEFDVTRFIELSLLDTLTLQTRVNQRELSVISSLVSLRTLSVCPSSLTLDLSKLTKLKELEVRYAEDNCQLLHSSPLKTLRLQYCHFSDKQVKSFLEPLLPHLKTLDIASHNATPIELPYEQFTNLESLTLVSPFFRQHEVRQLFIHVEKLKKLRLYQFSKYSISSGYTPLSEFTENIHLLRNLRKLWILSDTVSTTHSFASFSALPYLSDLWIGSGINLTTQHICEISKIESLVELSFCAHPTTEDTEAPFEAEWLDHLVALKNLRILSIGHCKDLDLAAKLKKLLELPKLELLYLEVSRDNSKTEFIVKAVASLLYPSVSCFSKVCYCST